MIRPVSPADSAAICEIYNYYIEHTVVTFEERSLTGLEMEERIRKISAGYPYLVWEDTRRRNQRLRLCKPVEGTERLPVYGGDYLLCTERFPGQGDGQKTHGKAS